MRDIFCALLFVTSCRGFCPAVPDGELPEWLEEVEELHADDESKIVEQGEYEKITQESKSMSELIEAATSDKMDAIFTLEGKKVTALALLEYMLKETTIEPEYLTNLFYKNAKAQSKEDLEKKILNEDKSLKFLSKILQHFQDNTDAGRPSGDTETSADQNDAQTESDNESEGATTENDEEKDEL